MMPADADNTSIPDDEQWRRWAERFRDGDPISVQAFWNQYGPLLHRIAEKHLAQGLRRRVGPEDVVQSACRTYFRRVQGGLLQLTDADNLWRLLCAITLTKVREQARFHGRRKRGLSQEVHIEPVSGDGSASAWHPPAPGPSPAQEVEFAEEFDRLLRTLHEEERQIVDLKLQDC